MPSAVIVIGAPEGCRRGLERYLGDRAELLLLRLAQKNGFSLEAFPQNAVQMVDAAAMRASTFEDVLVVQLPYAPCPEQLRHNIATLEELGAMVIRPQSGTGRWPARPHVLNGEFQAALFDALRATIETWLPGEVSAEDAASGVARARSDFAATLLIPNNVLLETSLDGDFWHRALRALHELCEIERLGKATNKRLTLSQLLAKHVKLPKQTYKLGDTGISCLNPHTGKVVELRERVHIVEGKPADTESIYWATFGDSQPLYRYLVGRIGRHA